MVAHSGKTDAVRDVEVRYAVRDGKRLAFEVFGSGHWDVVVVGLVPDRLDVGFAATRVLYGDVGRVRTGNRLRRS